MTKIISTCCQTFPERLHEFSVLSGVYENVSFIQQLPTRDIYLNIVFFLLLLMMSFLYLLTVLCISFSIIGLFFL